MLCELYCSAAAVLIALSLLPTLLQMQGLHDTEVVPFAGHIVMADGDQAYLFTGEGVVNGNPLAKTVAVLWHVEGL